MKRSRIGIAAFSMVFGLAIAVVPNRATTFRGEIMDSFCAEMGSHETITSSVKSVGDFTIDCVKFGAKYALFEGNLVFLGREEIRVAGARWPADKFELKVPMHPPFLIWTSPQGLLLDFTEEDNQKRLMEHGMKLVRYKQSASF